MTSHKQQDPLILHNARQEEATSNDKDFRLAIASELFTSLIAMFYGEDHLEFRILVVKPRMQGSRGMDEVPVVYLVERDANGEIERAMPIFELVALPAQIAHSVYEKPDFEKYGTTLVRPSDQLVSGGINFGVSDLHVPNPMRKH